MEAGAEEVVLEPCIVATARARVPEISEARSTSSKLRAYLDAKAIDYSNEDFDRLEGKLSVLEAGDSDAT